MQQCALHGEILIVVVPAASKRGNHLHAHQVQMDDIGQLSARDDLALMCSRCKLQRPNVLVL